MADDALDWIHRELAQWEQAGLWRSLQERSSPQQPLVTVDGRELINFSSNDYLGLAARELASAVVEAMECGGWGSGASPLVTGRSSLHAELERALARFEGTEAALLFTSGYAANVAAITSVVGRGDAVFSDEKNHASIIDGCRLSGAEIFVYPHVDPRGLAARLEQSGRFRRKLIVSDGLFSMDGDLAPVDALAELSERHRAMLMVDEAHATGVFGARGRGVAEELGVDELLHIRVGTLSKALGSLGGFVAGSQRLIDWLANRARPYVYSTAPPAALAAAGLRALQIVRQQPERRRRLLEMAGNLRTILADQGWQTGSSASQIIPIYLGDPDRTMRLARQLRDSGLLVPGIRPPSVPMGQSLLRISLTAAHDERMLRRLIEALQRLQSAAGGRGK